MTRIARIISDIPATLCIIVIWVSVYLLSVTHNIVPAACGKGFSVINREYYRFFTAGLVHQDVIHLLINGFAMFWIGYLYERQVGTLRFAVIGVFCAVVAQAIFLYSFPKVQSSIGGSCYNYALCGFAVVYAMLVPGFPKLKLGTWSGNWIVLYLLGANVPFLPFMDWTAIVIHGIAFALGAGMALLCWYFGYSKRI